jgi:hypothetical protein
MQPHSWLGTVSRASAALNLFSIFLCWARPVPCIPHPHSVTCLTHPPPVLARGWPDGEKTHHPIALTSLLSTLCMYSHQVGPDGEKPAPPPVTPGAAARQPSAYSQFVKANYALAKSAHPPGVYSLTTFPQLVCMVSYPSLQLQYLQSHCTFCTWQLLTAGKYATSSKPYTNHTLPRNV